VRREAERLLSLNSAKPALGIAPVKIKIGVLRESQKLPGQNPVGTPKGKGGGYLATDKLEHFLKWYTRGCNIFIAPGMTRLICIDHDYRNGCKPVYEWLKAKGYLPETVSVISASGEGSGHDYYALPDDVEPFRGGANRIGPGIDLKCKAPDLAVLPPSHIDKWETGVNEDDSTPCRIKIDGGTYKYAPGHAFGEHPVAVVHPEVLALIRTCRAIVAKKDQDLDALLYTQILKGLRAGNRDRGAYDLAQLLACHRIPKELAYAIIDEVAAHSDQDAPVPNWHAKVDSAYESKAAVAAMTASDGFFFVNNGCLYRDGGEDKDGEPYPDIPIATFDAEITGKVELDEGTGARTTVYELEARCGARSQCSSNCRPGTWRMSVNGSASMSRCREPCA
jgi:hypothetical protein